MSTEQKLWQSMQRAEWYDVLPTRIETGQTSVGVPDLYYNCAAREFRGWVELKVMNLVSRNRELYLNTRFTTHQFAWLCSNHCPAKSFRSYLMIGVTAARSAGGVVRWKHVVLIPAAPEFLLPFVNNKKNAVNVTWDQFSCLRGVQVHSTVQHAVAHLCMAD